MHTMHKKAHHYELKQWHIFAVVAVVISMVVFALSIAIMIFLPSIIEKNIRDGKLLTKESPLLGKWLNPAYHVQTRFWTYSVKNPDKVVNGSRPQLKRLGPYVFDQKFTRDVISNENGTIVFKTATNYKFNEHDSCTECFLHNRVWVPNLVFQKFVDAASQPATAAAAAALVVQTPFLEVEVDELLFRGYIDPFLDQVCAIPFVGFICEEILDLPDRIGLYREKNGTMSPTYVMSNGELDRGETLGKIHKYGGDSLTPESWWSNQQARMINGSDAALFKPFLTKTDAIELFSPDLCRSVKMVYDREVPYGELTANRYVFADDNFDFDLPHNAGFCNDNGKRFFEEQNSTSCLPNGLLDISRCTRGEPPVVISLPNFAHTPSYVQDSVEGLKDADDIRDRTQVDVEPRLGIILEGRRKFQVNIAMTKGENLLVSGLDLKHFRNSIVPVIELEEVAHIDDASMNEIVGTLIHAEWIVRVTAVSGVIASLIAGIMVIFYILHRTGRIRKVVRHATIRVRDAAHARSLTSKKARSTTILTPSPPPIPTTVSSQSSQASQITTA